MRALRSLAAPAAAAPRTASLAFITIAEGHDAESLREAGVNILSCYGSLAIAEVEIGKFNAIEGLKEAIRMLGVEGITTDPHNDRLILTYDGARRYKVYVGTEAALDTRVYSADGRLVHIASHPGDEMTLDLGNPHPRHLHLRRQEDCGEVTPSPIPIENAGPKSFRPAFFVNECFLLILRTKTTRNVDKHF